jgi:diaminopimelate epimerase
MRFTKMHGIGNDYVYVDCFHEKVANPVGLARLVSHRHFGIGSDGLILIMPSQLADVRMRMFNADGSEGLMCGNGIRCVAKYSYDHQLSTANPMRIETSVGIKTIDLHIEGGKVVSARVDMGEPMLNSTDIPLLVPQKQAIDIPIRAGRQTYNMTCVSMGNPHAVIYVDIIAAVPLEQVGPEIEKNPLFPQRVNVHFVQVHSPSEVTMCTWERGSGVTLACGTGASAVCAAGVLTGRTGREIVAHLPGGDLKLEWRQENNHLYMTGPATEVFSGDWPGE